ncbi:DUF4190 domain-containing protein [Micromonospora sp. CPCC 205371]|nr:DUF4190 domain-containing protein [Micromonospora sp. CPCC 205371]
MSYPQQPGNWSDPSWPQQQPGYQDPAYAVSGQPAPAYPGYGYQPVASPPTNGLAIAALVCALAGIATCISAPVGAILGHVARRQIRERGEAGDGMALAGIIVGWIITGLMVLLVAFYVVIIILAINSDTTGSDF